MKPLGNHITRVAVHSETCGSEQSIFCLLIQLKTRKHEPIRKLPAIQSSILLLIRKLSAWRFTAGHQRQNTDRTRWMCAWRKSLPLNQRPQQKHWEDFNPADERLSSPLKLFWCEKLKTLWLSNPHTHVWPPSEHHSSLLLQCHVTRKLLVLSSWQTLVSHDHDGFKQHHHHHSVWLWSIINKAKWGFSDHTYFS